MTFQTTTVTNISQQIIKVLFSKIAASASTTSIPPNTAGELAIVPGTQLTIETNRLDLGQIRTFQRKGLLTSVTY